MAILLWQFLSSLVVNLASYIPKLTKANPDWFAISVVTTDGEVFEALADKFDLHFDRPLSKCSFLDISETQK